MLGAVKPRLSPEELWLDTSNILGGNEVLWEVVGCDTENELLKPMPISLNPKFSGEVAVKVDEDV